ncbi:MAG TPA: protein ndvB, partial [Steroidobacteraceae bacterium]|nr:protein ndvB [Steroidobacteraceae bacterium]
MIATPRIFFGLKSFESPWKTDRLIREDLFSVERLEQHAASLAEAQVVSSNAPVRRSINARVRQNETVLLRAYRAIAIAISEAHDITPAAEWLIDNYHVVEEQMRQIHDDLPPRYYRQLPKLASGPLSGYPRVLGLAWAYVAHTDSRFDPDTLRRFVRAYQRVQPLTIGELWAVAITLRIILVENLRRAAERIVSSRIARQNADHVADQLLGDKGWTADPQVLIRRYNNGDELPAAFIVQVVKRLRDQDPRVTPALTWLEKGLTERGTTSDEIVRDEHQRQGASNVTVRNIITSMRLISDVNWQDFFEDASLVDKVLSTAGNFAEMDFGTRNLYRGAIEDLARGTDQTELQIARAVVAVALAHASAAGPQATRQSDPGYHLLARARPEFERSVGYRAPPGKWLSRFTASIGPGGYICALLLLTAAALAWPVWILAGKGIEQWQSALLALLGAIPAMDVAVALLNRAVTRGVSATMLPGMALREGIPPDLRTLVVVPTLLTTPAAIEEQIERLEVHYLATSQGAVHFALLSDWTDAATESTDEDETLLAIASAGIARLNRTYGPVEGGKRFYLFHRRRLWSPGQRQWIGWERKRGKLHELNQLLRGAGDTSFVSDAHKSPTVPAGVRYVITLDADTRLPRETVRRLIGKLAHPLNQPRFDALSGRVIEGYAVLQPRVTASLPVGREGSLFQRVFSSMSGIDAYGAAVSDVYQDLFGEGSYAGKGIYEIDAFEAALANRVPEGSLLSHDLFEGTFARSGLASDIEVVEEYPGRYDVAAARNHRWARGDWQLLPWILGRRDAARDGLREGGGHLPLIGRWKMLDNLRRTLSAPSCVLALLIGWTLPLYAAVLWTVFVFATIALPPLLPVLAAIVPSRRGIVPRSHLRALSQDLIRALMQIALGVTFLAHQAWLMADAIVRTLFRLIVIRRNLLEWVTAAQTQLSFDLGTAGFYRRMGGSIVIALITLLEIAWFRFDAGWIAVPIALLWICAPEIARRVSVSPPDARRLYVSPADGDALRWVARRTWRFFETFVTPADNMLPPDNFQEDPLPVLAHRTSPTNLGLYLLCVVSARDFGWIG